MNTQENLEEEELYSVHGHEQNADISKVANNLTRRKSVVWEVPDGGYGWVVTIAYCISIGIQQLSVLFGIMFSPPLIEMGASSHTIALVYAVYFTIWNLMGPFVGPFAQEFGWRKVGFIASLLTSISYITSAFATSPLYLVFSFSVLSGIAGSFTGNMAFLLISSYFRHNLGLANAVLLSGVGVGSFAGPLYVNYFLEQYTFKGAAIINGALVLNGCAMALLYHPVGQHMKKVEIDSEECNPLPLQPDVLEIQNKCKLNAKFEPQMYRKFSGIYINECKYLNGNPLARRSSLHYSTLDIGGLTHISSIVALSSLDVNENHEHSAETETEIILNDSKSIVRTFVNVFKRTIGCITIMRSFRAIILVIGGVFIQNVRVNFHLMVPFALQSEGHSLKTAAWCVSMSAITDAIMKIFISAISDRSWFNKRIFYMSGTVLISLSITVFSLVSSLLWLKLSMALYGLGIGTVMALYNLVMVEFLGHDNLSRIVGATCWASAIGAFTIGPIAGWIRDSTNSYSLSLQFFAAISFCNFLLWTLMPLAQKIDLRKQELSKEVA